MAIKLEPMADETEIKDEIDDFSPAFDSIDANMKLRRRRREVTITLEKLTQVVNDAVAKALAAYEQARVARLERAKPPAPPSRWKAKIERLKGDMGLEEIAFDQARPALADMGISDFTLDDSPAPAPAAAPAPVAAPVPAADPTPVPARAPEPIAAADSEAIRKHALGEAAKTLFSAFDPVPPVPAPLAPEPEKTPED